MPLSQSSTAAGSALSPVTLVAVAALVIVGGWLQLVNPTASDVSWLFVVVERLLSGETLYRDLIETNPPMSIALYVPAVLIGRVVGLPAEVVQVGLTMAILIGSLALSVRILRLSGNDEGLDRFVVFAAFVLIILPMFTFSQREHLALAFLLPIVLAIGGRAGGTHFGWGVVVVAGLAAGLGVAIKPQFALVMMLPAAYAVIRRRSLWPAFAPENLLAVAFVAAYVGLVILGTPRFATDILPAVSDTYRLARVPLGLLFGLPSVIIVSLSIVGSLVLAGSEGRTARVIVIALAATGFLLAYLEQAKGWPYHLYPAMALAFLLVLTIALPRLTYMLGKTTASAGLRIGSAVLALVLLGGVASRITYFKYANPASLALIEPIKAMGPHPKLLSITYDLAIGHPLTRMVDGRWVGSVCSQWLTYSAALRLRDPASDAATQERMRGWIARDVGWLVQDLRSHQPDAVLIDHETVDADGPLLADPAVRQELAAYRLSMTVNGVDLMVRK